MNIDPVNYAGSPLVSTPNLLTVQGLQETQGSAQTEVGTADSYRLTDTAQVVQHLLQKVKAAQEWKQIEPSQFMAMKEKEVQQATLSIGGLLASKLVGDTAHVKRN